MPTTNRPDTQIPPTKEPETPEKQKQKKGFKPDSYHCKKNNLFENFDSPPDGNTDHNVV